MASRGRDIRTKKKKKKKKKWTGVDGFYVPVFCRTGHVGPGGCRRAEPCPAEHDAFDSDPRWASVRRRIVGPGWPTYWSNRARHDSPRQQGGQREHARHICLGYGVGRREHARHVGLGHYVGRREHARHVGLGYCVGRREHTRYLAEQSPHSGGYVGDGMPPVPAKLVNKIRRWEFIEMGELLPEFWVGPKEAEGDVGKEKRGRQSRKVTDVLTWLQCFGTYVAVLATHEPTIVPELMAYMGLIIRVSQDYEGLGWVRYDSAFRRQEALSGNKKWSAVNGTLFTMNFSGRASGTRRCELCFATSHSERECAQSGNPEPDVGERLRSLESVLITMARPSPPVRPQRLSGQVCRKWNTVGCTFPSCRHAHVCSSCGGNHPAVRCGGPGPTPRFMATRPPHPSF